MCGRFVADIPADELKKIFDLIESPRIEPRYNLAPSQSVGVIRCCAPEGRNRFDLLKWGLTPSWAKDPAIGNSLINARSETVAEKPSFRSAYRHRRCIIPASGFYEWQKTGDTVKQPLYITSADGSPLSFAGLWEQWRSPNGIEIQTFAILTTAANELLRPIHDRMPVILANRSIGTWLDLAARTEEIAPLLRPYPSETLEAYPVSQLVNNPSHDSPDCIARI